MIIKNIKGKDVIISDRESELDIQFELTEKLKAIWCTCRQNCTVYVSCMENKAEYWKDKKTDKSTRKKMFLDMLVTRWNDIAIVEMKREWNKSNKQMTYIRWQIEKYESLWIKVFLCNWRDMFDYIISYFRFSGTPSWIKYRKKSLQSLKSE